MSCSWVRLPSVAALACCVWGGFFGGAMVMAAPAIAVEPGLETAIGWKWWVVPSVDREWGMPLPEELAPKAPGTPGAGAAGSARPEVYEVKKGDAIVKIARKFEMTPWQLMKFNELKDDRIVIGQTLRIPTPLQLLTLVPPPPPAPEPKKETAGKKKKQSKPEPDLPPLPEVTGEAELELENVRLQVFLDREMYSPGMIDGKAGPTFLKISEVYQRNHPDAADPAQLKAKAEAAVPEPYTRYVLRADDFRFIQYPKKQALQSGGKSPAPKKKSSKQESAAKAPVVPLVTIDGLMAEGFLGYANAWEFVAERFHCDEAFLRRINPGIKGMPVVGAEIQVPNVVPFEIEKALDAPLQPAADPTKPVVAAVVLLSRLEIRCDGELIAVMPLASARPGLCGRGSWTVMDAVPQPRLATKRELREPPKPTVPAAGEGAVPVVPVVPPPLDQEQYLAPGPNNPVGVLWIHLAKSGSKDPLPYGLHGTGIPGRMKTQQGLGGFRLSNWDIARAVRLIPAGSPLQWRAK